MGNAAKALHGSVTEISEDTTVTAADDRRTFLVQADVHVALRLDDDYPDDFTFAILNQSKKGSITVLPKQTAALHIGGGGLGHCGDAVYVRDFASHTWRKSGSLWFSVGGYSANMSFDRTGDTNGRVAAAG